MQIISKDLTLSFDGDPVVKDLNFSVEKGDYLCVLGENGSGKSTLLRAILGLVPVREGVLKFGDGITRRDIGYLPQREPDNSDFPASVKEVVHSGCLNKCGFFPILSKSMKKRAEENMKRLGIFDLKDRCVSELSGGQRQRVMLARALCAGEKLLILDEPITGLDVYATEELYTLIKELNLSGLTVIMVSHDIESALKYSNKILHIGHPDSFFGTTEEYVDLMNNGGQK